MLLFYSHFFPLFNEGDQNLTPCSKKNDLTGPLSSYKIFSSAASISASQGLSSLLSAWHGLSQVFQESWGGGGGRKAVSSPSSLTEIKLKMLMALARQLLPESCFAARPSAACRADRSLGEACAPLQNEVTN